MYCNFARYAMTAAQRKFTEMLLSLARSVRRGRDVELARAAADWEIELQTRLDDAANVLPMAASFAQRSDDPGADRSGS